MPRIVRVDVHNVGVTFVDQCVVHPGGQRDVRAAFGGGRKRTPKRVWIGVAAIRHAEKALLTRRAGETVKHPGNGSFVRRA